jgi:hypothetical protein
MDRWRKKILAFWPIKVRLAAPIRPTVGPRWSVTKPFFSRVDSLILKAVRPKVVC